MESSKSNFQAAGVFTRNPQDRYLTPMPPKSLPTPRLGDLCKERYAVPMQTYEPPRSATYPRSLHTLPPGYERHVRSASTSPALVSATVFDFKALKSKRSASSGRGRMAPRNMKELEIGAPTLISTTAEDVTLIPLPSGRIPQSSTSLPASISAKLREFSPLGSHPVDSSNQSTCSILINDEDGTPKRPRSQVQPGSPPALKVVPGRIRANSAGTRRTKIFSNEPWITSPRLFEGLVVEEEPAPVLQKPFEPASTSTDERPSSRHGGGRALSLRKLPLDKDLPALPRYLVPAPLFACHSGAPSPALQEEEEEAHAPNQEEAAVASISHFSTWSADSLTFSAPASDDGIVHSPTFSSLTSASSETGSPERDPIRFTYGNEACDDDVIQSFRGETMPDDDDRRSESPSIVATSLPPFKLPMPTFETGMFQLDIQQSTTGSRRQAACFGLSGFQGYSLPEDDTTSQVTITKTNSAPSELTITSQERGSSITQLEKLMDEFGFMGEAVL